MYKILKKIDIFGTTFNFRIHNEDSFKTPLGGLFSVFTVGVIIIFSFFFGVDFYYKLNPLIFTNTIVPDKYDPPFRLTPENFVIAWRIENYDKLKIETDKFIYPVQKESLYKKNSKGTLELKYEKELPLKKCTEENAKVKELTNFFNLDDWYCFDWTMTENFWGGFWDGDYLNWYQLFLYLCDHGADYSSDNPSCVKMKDYWDFETKNNGGLVISVLYPQYYFSAEDSQNPLRITYKNFYYYFSPRTYKIDRFFFNKVTLRDDKGWIFEDIQEKTIWSLNRMGSDQNVNEIVDGKSSQMYEFNLYQEKGSQTIKRSYMKIQDVGAKVGGIIKVVMVIFGLLNSFFSYHKFQISVFDEIFSYTKNDYYKQQNEKEKTFDKSKLNSFLFQASRLSNNQSNKSPEKSQINSKNEPNSKNNFFSNNNEDAISAIKKNNYMSKISTVNLKKDDLINSFEENNQEIISLNKSNLVFSYYFKLKYTMCRRSLKNSNNKKEKIFDVLGSFLNYRLDLISYIKYLNKFDKIKSIFFSEIQEIAFDYEKKHNVFRKNELMKITKKAIENDQKIKDKILFYYQEGIKNESLNEIDKKILETLPNDVRHKILKGVK